MAPTSPPTRWCAPYPTPNIGGLLDELPEHAEIYAAADKLGATPIVSTNLYLDRPLGTESAFEGLIGGTGVIDEVFDRQIMHGRSTERRGCTA